MAAAAILVSGCAVSYRLNPDDTKDSPPRRPAAVPTARSAGDNRASLSDRFSAAHPAPRAAAAMAADADLVHARAAIADAFTKDVSTKAAAWENPATGAHGTITPVSGTYSKDGGLCRDFLASYVRQSDETWLEGAACKGQSGRWQVQRLTPWKQA